MAKKVETVSPNGKRREVTITEKTKLALKKALKIKSKK